MPVTDRRADTGRRLGRALLQHIGRELREARISAGLSQRDVARAAGVSQSLLSRIERATATSVSAMVIATISAVLGLRMTIRHFPVGDPLRDAGHARLLERFRRLLPAGARLLLEVLIGVPGDARAWDAELAIGGERCKVEAETVIRDLQATDRRIARKMADGGVDRVILVIADTAANRRVLREFRQLISERYPLSGREIARCLRQGRCPPRSGIIVL